MTVRTTLLAVLAVLALAGASPAVGQDEPPPGAAPAAVVARVTDALLSVMREADTLGFQGRYDRLAPVLSEAFHFGFMARAAAGRHWDDLDAGQREAMVESFRRLSLATFAARFDGYSGQRFEIGETVQHPRGTVLVRNRLVKRGGDSVSIDYLLRDFDGHWRIIDVFLDGTISEIATKRSEYGSVIQREGFEALLSRISEKVDELAADGG